jgi:hypothetical protein
MDSSDSPPDDEPDWPDHSEKTLHTVMSSRLERLEGEVTITDKYGFIRGTFLQNTDFSQPCILTQENKNNTFDLNKSNNLKNKDANLDLYQVDLSLN